MSDCELEIYDFMKTSESNIDFSQFDFQFDQFDLSNAPSIEDFIQINEIKCGKKRGRKSRRIGIYKIHDKKYEDNINRKIQVHYVKFIKDFINELLKTIGIKNLFFIPLDYNSIKLISKKHRAILNSKTIKEVFYDINISRKYSTKELDFNKKTCEKIEKEYEDVYQNILSKKFLFFFDKIYIKKNKKINMKEFGFDNLEIDLKNIELFGDLLLKEKDDNYLIEKMDFCAKKFFCPKIPKMKHEIFKCTTQYF